MARIWVVSECRVEMARNGLLVCISRQWRRTRRGGLGGRGMRGMFLEVGYLDVVKLDVSMYLGKYYVVCRWVAGKAFIAIAFSYLES